MPMANAPGVAKRLAITLRWYLAHARLARRISEVSGFSFPLVFKKQGDRIEERIGSFEGAVHDVAPNPLRSCNQLGSLCEITRRFRKKAADVFCGSLGFRLAALYFAQEKIKYLVKPMRVECVSSPFKILALAQEACAEG